MLLFLGLWSKISLQDRVSDIVLFSSLDLWSNLLLQVGSLFSDLIFYSR